MKLPPQWIVPDWAAPAHVRAFVTTRHGGTSEGEHAAMNLGSRCGDDPARVANNRRILREHLPRMPRWLAQVHGADVADLDALGEHVVAVADAAVARLPGHVAAVLAADCMPVFLCDESGQRVGVAHAGWRGLAAGVLENAVAALGAEPSRVLAWMGPAIGPEVFEVGAEVREAFVAVEARAAEAFRPHGAGKFLADLYALARQRLDRTGVTRVTGGGYCTFTDSDRFFSYRRARLSGRMAAVIWIE
jgi:YfiH family protein